MGSAEEACGASAASLRTSAKEDVPFALFYLLSPDGSTATLAKALRAQGSGHIINVSAVAGRVSRPFGGAYAASKHALEALSDSLYWELRPFGVGVTVFEPGFLKTDIHKRHVPTSRSEMSPYRRDELALKQTLAKFAAKADDPGLAASVLADIVEGKVTGRRIVFGDQARGLIAMGAALGEDATALTYAEAVLARLPPPAIEGAR